MKYLLFALLTISTFHATAQETKPVSKKSGVYREEYSVLVSDKKIKHGPYRKYKGKDKLVAEGSFENNTRTGEWKFYADGELDQTYDFTTKELKFNRKPGYASQAVINGQVQNVQLDTPPSYVGSKVGLNDALNSMMTYPNAALRMGIAGKVIVSLWVDENNEISDIKVLNGVTAECDQEVINGLSRIEKLWISGTKDGNKVKSELGLVIEFKLHDNGDKTITVL